MCYNIYIYIPNYARHGVCVWCPFLSSALSNRAVDLTAAMLKHRPSITNRIYLYLRIHTRIIIIVVK